MKQKLTRTDGIIILSMLCLILLLVLPKYLSSTKATNQADTNGDGQVTLADYQGKRIGSITGVNFDDVVDKFFPGTELHYYTNYSDLAVAMKAKLIDGFIIGEDTLNIMMQEDPSIGKMPEDLAAWDMSFAFSEKSSIQGLKDQMDLFLKEFKQEGGLDELREIWFGNDESRKVIPSLDSLPSENGTVKVALESTYAPVVYLKDQKIVGYEIDLLYRFCTHYHYGLQLMDMSFDAILPAVVSGTCDIGASGLQYNEEHAASVTMSQPHLTAHTSLAVPMSDLVGVQEDTGESKGLLKKLFSSLEKNFIKESRWKLIVQGLLITCVITLLSALFGSLLGFGICLLRRTHSRLANPLSDGFIHLIRGIPMVVLLMFLFYVVFSGTMVSSIFVAVVGFTLTFGSVAAEVMQSGLDSVDHGQEEAALSLGFSRNQTFFLFLFPQAMVHFLPVYRSELIMLLNDTSIVGYIAVQDLTKMSDIIRSRSYDAFTPLVVSTLIYFLLARIITWAIDCLLKRIDPKRGKKK